MTSVLYLLDVSYIWYKEEEYGVYGGPFEKFEVISKKINKENQIRRYETHTIKLGDNCINYLNKYQNLKRASTGSTSVWINDECAIKFYYCKEMRDKTREKLNILNSHNLSPKVIDIWSSEKEHLLVMENGGETLNLDKYAELCPEALSLYKKAEKLGFDIDDACPDNVVVKEGKYKLIDPDGWDHPQISKYQCECHKSCNN